MIVTPNTPHLVSTILDPRWRRRLLADGDSWFSIGGWTGNLLMALDDTDTLIVNCAYPGDDLADSRAIGNDEFAHLLAPTHGLTAWDAVLLSAGGNDVIKACSRFVRRTAEPGPHLWLDYDALHEVLSDFEQHLVRFMRLCQAGQPGVPVLCHTYDYPPVTRRTWFWRLGPWIAPVFRAAGIPRSEWVSAVEIMIDELAQRMHNVAADYPLVVVDTRNTLLPEHWRNEIHPTLAGYSLLANPWRRLIDQATSPH